jgi:hypothetical protein
MYHAPDGDFQEPSSVDHGSRSIEETAATINNVITSLPEMLRQLGRASLAANRIANQYEAITKALCANGVTVPDINLHIFFLRGNVQELARFMVRTGILDLTDGALVGIDLG